MNLLLLEDHPIFRLGVRQLLLQRWPQAVIHESATLAEALRACRQGSFATTLADLNLHEGRTVDLAHARVGRHQHPRRAHLQRERLQASDRGHTEIRRQRDALRDAAGQAQPGEGPGPGAEGDRVELRHGEPGLGEELAQVAQHRLGMIGRALDAPDEQLVAVQHRDAAVLGGGFDGEDVHGAAILPAARRFVRRRTHAGVAAAAEPRLRYPPRTFDRPIRRSCRGSRTGAQRCGLRPGSSR